MAEIWFAEKRYGNEFLLENDSSSCSFHPGCTGNVRSVGAGQHRFRLRPAYSAFREHRENRLSAVSLHVSRTGRGAVPGRSTGAEGFHLDREPQPEFQRSLVAVGLLAGQVPGG